MRLYRISGLNVASEFELPGAIDAEPGAAAEIEICRGDVPDELAVAQQIGPTWQIAGGRLLLQIPGIARFLLSDGDRIVVQPASADRLVDIPIFLTGNVFGILLQQRGRVVLHASAVEVDGHAVLFCGGSGAGKSTLAAALAERGYPVVADDVCALSREAAGAPLVHPDGRQLKLWDQAIGRLGLGERRGARVRPSLEKFYVEPAGFAETALPVRAIYSLREARPPHQPGIERPNVVDAALLLRRSAYRPLLVRSLGQQEAYFHAAVGVSRFAGVFHFTRELGFANLPDMIEALERHWLAMPRHGACA